MKKTLFAFISFVLIFTLFGCTANSNYEETEPTLSDEEISLQQQEFVKIGFSATDDEDVMLITDTGTIIRLKVKDISILGRPTQGVTLMRTTDGGRVVSIETLTPEIAEVEDGE